MMTASMAAPTHAPAGLALRMHSAGHELPRLPEPLGHTPFAYVGCS